MDMESWKTRPVTDTDWSNYFVWVDRIILKINYDERTEYRLLMSNIHKLHREYQALEHQSRLKHNPITTKKQAEDKLAELHAMVDFLGESLMFSRLVSSV